MQNAFLAELSSRKGISLASLREETIAKLWEKVAELEPCAGALDALRSEGEVKSKKIDMLRTELENMKKERDMLEKELRASESIIRLKSDEVVNVSEKLANAEDIQDRLRHQIAKDADRLVAQLSSR